MLLLRLPGRKNCDRVRVKGALWKGKHFNVRWLMGSPYHLSEKPTESAFYIGVLSSTKLDKLAVKRNRMRRRCREAFRLTIKARGKKPLPAASTPPSTLSSQLPSSRSLQLLLLPRSSSLSCTFNELSDEVSRFLSSVHL